MRTKKNILFREEEKNVHKRTKADEKRILYKSTFKLQNITLASALVVALAS